MEVSLSGEKHFLLFKLLWDANGISTSSFDTTNVCLLYIKESPTLIDYVRIGKMRVSDNQQDLYESKCNRHVDSVQSFDDFFMINSS